MPRDFSTRSSVPTRSAQQICASGNIGNSFVREHRLHVSDDIGDTFQTESHRVFRSGDMGDSSRSVRASAPDDAVEGQHAPDTLVLEVSMMLRVEDPERKL